MTEIFLGVIAVAVTAMAAVQVAAIASAAKAAKRVSQLVIDLERDVRPIVANLRTLSADAARAAALAASQVDKADHLLSSLSTRVDDALTSIQNALAQPAREGLAILHGLRAALSAFRETGATPRRRPATRDEDELFIG